MDKVRTRTIARRNGASASFETTGRQSGEQFPRQNYSALLRGGCRPGDDRAERVDRTPQWVRHIIHRFNRGGVGAIEWCPYWQVRGAPRKVFAEVVEQIAEVAISSPKSLIGMTQWSLS